MTEQPDLDRYKPDMPRIPGLANAPGQGPARSANLNVIAALLGVLFVVGLGAHFALRPRHIDAIPVAAPPQLQVPTPAPDPYSLLPVASNTQPVVATVAEMSKP